MASEAEILQPTARLASVFAVEWTMNQTYQIVMRSCYKADKILGVTTTATAYENVTEEKQLLVGGKMRII